MKRRKCFSKLFMWAANCQLVTFTTILASYYRFVCSITIHKWNSDVKSMGSFRNIFTFYVFYHTIHCLFRIFKKIIHFYILKPSNTEPVVYGSSIHKHIKYYIVFITRFNCQFNGIVNKK